jgi:hypothetical protein
MATINHTGKLYTREEAERIAKAMTETDEDGWTYVPNHDPKGTGYSFIEVHDETGEFVAKL